MFLALQMQADVKAAGYLSTGFRLSGMWRMGVGGKLIADLEMREWGRLFGYTMAAYFHIHTFRIFFCDAPNLGPPCTSPAKMPRGLCLGCWVG